MKQRSYKVTLVKSYGQRSCHHFGTMREALNFAHKVEVSHKYWTDGNIHTVLIGNIILRTA